MTKTLEKEKDIKLVYHSNYWDGPLSGVCLYKEKQYWFNCVHDYHDKTEDNESLDMRIYAIYDLTPIEWEHENYWHNLFVRYVGTHTSYDDNGCRKGKVGPAKDHHLFYDAAKEAGEKGIYKKKDLTENKLVGYFDAFEKVFRKTKYRDYWVEGESPYSTHSMEKGLCPNYELIEWRNDAQKWDNFDSDFEGITSSWAICIQPDGPDEGKPFWLSIKNCPWCGFAFKEKAVINGLSFSQRLDAEEKAKKEVEQAKESSDG